MTSDSTPGRPVSMRFGDFRLDLRRRVLEGPEGVVPLQPKVFELLLHLVENADAAVTKDELLDTVWRGTIVTESVLTRAVRALRVALGDDAAEPCYVLALRGVGYRFVAPVERDEASRESTPLRSVAVFPFRSLSPDCRDEALELGLADTLIAHLSKWPYLVVRTLDSAQSSLASASGPEEAARALTVDVYFVGSLQEAGDRLRVNARLVSTESGESLWSESFQQPLDELLDLQDALCARIIQQLNPRMTTEGISKAPKRDVPADAYRAYLEGRLYLSRHRSADITEAMERFQAALDSAPGYPEAWAALGECHELLATEGGEEAGEHYAAALRASRRALAVAPDLPEARCLTAKVAWQHAWDWPGADAAFRAALGLYPNRADLHIHYSDFLGLRGRAPEAIEHARRAVSIDPVSPWFNTLLVQGLYLAQRYGEAEQQAERTLKLAPEFSFARFFAGLVRFCSGDEDAGLAQLRTSLTAGRVDFQAALALCLGLAGRTAEAEAILVELERTPRVGPFALALAQLGCGDVDAATRGFQHSVDLRDWHVLLVPVDPLFASYREHEDYAALAGRPELR